MSTPHPLGEDISLTGSRTAENLTARAHEGIDQLAAGASAAERKVREQASRMNEQFGTAAERARERSMQVKQQVSDYAGSNPMTSLALAFVAGVLLTVLMRR
ncbi:MAG: hypothetical protein MUF07_15880 [Steroidobacteraceae bacterium]|jgi:ElaB/YqjD/DUF883 family membrane-anchored ribosome-binding protein|nr:hypothetical protein [Steroidobacteraceae bacterium]